jgi:hypothetical protein
MNLLSLSLSLSLSSFFMLKLVTLMAKVLISAFFFFLNGKLWHDNLESRMKL